MLKNHEVRFNLIVFLIGFFLLLIPTASMCDTPKRGGTFKMATHSEIPGLDCMVSSADVVYEVGGNIFETLVQYITADGKLAPELADSWEISPETFPR